MKRSPRLPNYPLPWLLGAVVLALAVAGNNASAYERYSSCAACHGVFTGPTSPQGTVFPSGDKHRMHRNSANMATDCRLCHRSDDGDDPFTGSSDGVPASGVPGLGCTGCHVASGLRAHHVANNISCIGSCHGAETPPAENVKPPYYGTAFTKADNPCNPVAVANTNENWSAGDFVGLDNDGNNLYDMADFACGPYQIVRAAREGNNMRITWDTAGGRRDVIQASPAVKGTYTNVSSPLPIPGIGIFRTNYVEAGGATNRPARFYRVIYSP